VEQDALTARGVPPSAGRAEVAASQRLLQTKRHRRAAPLPRAFLIDYARLSTGVHGRRSLVRAATPWRSGTMPGTHFPNWRSHSHAIPQGMVSLQLVGLSPARAGADHRGSSPTSRRRNTTAPALCAKDDETPATCRLIWRLDRLTVKSTVKVALCANEDETPRLAAADWRLDRLTVKSTPLTNIGSGGEFASVWTLPSWANSGRRLRD
jgi:hypothetical protein